MLIIGLGNPGTKYERTLHNVGFCVLDKLAQRLNMTFKENECKSITALAYKGTDKLILAKPQTYMNLSGEAVRELVGKYGVQAQDMLVIYDDIDLDIGVIRVRREGSAGTHNGMRNIIALLARQDFPRLRIGIGRPPKESDLANYVLSRPHGEDMDKLESAFDKAAEIIADYITHRDIDKLMRQSK